LLTLLSLSVPGKTTQKHLPDMHSDNSIARLFRQPNVNLVLKYKSSLLIQKNSTIFYSIIYTLLIVAFVSCRTTEKEKGCEQFKSGNFVFHINAPEYQTDFIIQRDDSIQTELEKKTGRYSKFRVNWTGPCTYELIMIESTFVFPDSLQKIRKTLPTKTEITGWTKDYYLFSTMRDGSNYVLKDTMWVNNY
jgi:hypothetical protein